MSNILSIDATSGLRNAVEMALARNRSMETPRITTASNQTVQSEHTVVNSAAGSALYRDRGTQISPISRLPVSVFEAVNSSRPVDFDVYTSNAFLVTQVPKSEASTFNLVV